MAVHLKDEDVSCLAIDEDTALIKIKNQTFVLDYSSLADMTIHFAQAMSRMENLATTQVAEIH